MKIIWKGSPNFDKNRKPVDRIVLHWFGVGTLDSANQRFQNKESKASAHYGISDETIYQWVKDEHVAYHSGNYEMNQRSIGIEHDATETKTATDKTYKSSAELVAILCKKYAIALDRIHIIGHREVKPTKCPGTLDLDRIIREAEILMQQTGEPSEIIQCKAQLADEIKKKNETWQELQEVKSDLEGVKAENITHQNDIKTLSITLQSEPEMASILGKITTLISEEDRLRKAVQDSDEAKQKLDDCQSAKKEIELINSQQAQTILEFRNLNESLKKELENCKQGGRLTPFFNIGGIYFCTEAKENGKT